MLDDQQSCYYRVLHHIHHDLFVGGLSSVESLAALCGLSCHKAATHNWFFFLPLLAIIVGFSNTGDDIISNVSGNFLPSGFGRRKWGGEEGCQLPWGKGTFRPLTGPSLWSIQSVLSMWFNSSKKTQPHRERFKKAIHTGHYSLIITGFPPHKSKIWNSWSSRSNRAWTLSTTWQS